jgi:uncharacterized cupin superfamily protein
MHECRNDRQGGPTMSDGIRGARPLRLDEVPERQSTGCPAPFDRLVAGRFRRCPGDAFGPGDFGVNLTRLGPGAATSQRHWHTEEDEFVLVLEGEVVLVDDSGERVPGPGMCVGFPKGVDNAHHFVNRGERPAVLLEIGSRRPETDEVFYADIDLRCLPGRRFAHRDGTPYEAP